MKWTLPLYGGHSPCLFSKLIIMNPTINAHRDKYSGCSTQQYYVAVVFHMILVIKSFKKILNRIP